MNYRKKANITLAVVAAGFIGATILKHYFNDSFEIKLISFVIEAALVGGVADWFAVTALFKEPLGFSFHTAIIPKNRVTIIDSVAKVVERELLSIDLIKKRLDKIKIIDGIINWIDNKNGMNYIIKVALEYVSGCLNRVDIRKIAEQAKVILGKGIEKIDLSQYYSKFIIWGLEKEEGGRIVSRVIEDIIKLIEENNTRDKIYELLNSIKEEKTKGFLSMFFNKTLEKTNSVNISELTDSIHMHLLEFLYAAKDERNEMNYKLREFLKQHFIVTSSIYLSEENINKIKEGILESICNEEVIKDTIEWLKKQLKKGMYINYELEDKVALTCCGGDGVPEIIANIQMTLLSYWNELKNNNDVRKNMEDAIKNSIYDIIQEEHGLVGDIVRDTLNEFTDEDLNNLIDEKAGNDLQWIRINGSIVGGGVGLLIFMFLNFLYEPYVVPVIRNLFS